MKKLLAILLGLGPFAGLAQAPTTATRADSAIHLNVVPNGRHSSAFYTVNQEPLTTATVKKLLKSYPPAAAELRKDRAHTRWGLLVMLPLAEAALLVGARQAEQQKNAPGSNFSKAPVAFSICLSALVGGVYLGASNNHFAKAIEAYNQRFH